MEDDPLVDDSFGFLYYGKAYDLDTDVNLFNNGLLTFADTPFKVIYTSQMREVEMVEGDDCEDNEDCGDMSDMYELVEVFVPHSDFSGQYPPAIMPFLFQGLPDVGDFHGEGFYVEGFLNAIISGSDEENPNFVFTVDGEEVSPSEFLAAYLAPSFPSESPVPNKELAIEYVPQNIFEAPEEGTLDIVKNQDFYRYTWDTLHESIEIDDDGGETRDFPPFSTTLYKNNWISFVYADIAEEIYADDADMPMYLLLTGLIPGDSEGADHPGVGLGRDLEGLDLSEALGEILGSDEYLAIGEAFYDTRDLEDYMGDIADYVENNWDTISQIIESLGYNPNDVDINWLIDQLADQQKQFDLSEQFVVFEPDAAEGFSSPDQGIGNKYKVHTGNPFMIADRSRHNFDDGYSSLDEAIVHIANNPNTLDDDFRPGSGYGGYDTAWEGIERWDYYPANSLPHDRFIDGQYEYGLQTVGGYGGYGGLQGGYSGSPWQGKQYTPYYTQEKLDQDNFLAYVVQVEEDRVNEKILEMSSRADWQALKNGIRDYDNIKERDAFFVQNADAQAGRVMKDIHGNWVRVQQYVLRPDAKTVQVLNVSLREAGDPNLSGMSTIDFKTTFTDELGEYQDFKRLPWGDYLTTRYDDGDNKLIRYYASFAEELFSMTVKFTNPGNESVTESRYFHTMDYTSSVYGNDFNGNPYDAVQYVSSGILSLQNAVTTQSYGNSFDRELQDDSWVMEIPEYQYKANFVVGDAGGYYGSNQTTYTARDEIEINPENKILDVNIHAVVDDYSGSYGTGGLPSGEPASAELSARDIWAVLGANEPGGVFVSEGESVEIIMSNPGNDEGGFFAKPIDTIFIPMSHMLWAWNNDGPA